MRVPLSSRTFAFKVESYRRMSWTSPNSTPPFSSFFPSRGCVPFPVPYLTVRRLHPGSSRLTGCNRSVGQNGRVAFRLIEMMTRFTEPFRCPTFGVCFSVDMLTYKYSLSIPVSTVLYIFLLYSRRQRVSMSAPVGNASTLTPLACWSSQPRSCLVNITQMPW